MLSIRPIVKGDEESYVRVHNEGYSTEEWWGIVAKPITIEDVSNLNYDATYLAEVDGQVIGLVDTKIYGDEVHIENLVVLQNHRRKGIGTRLLKEAMGFSKSKGIQRIRAETPIQNANKIYEKNGFKLVNHAFLIKIQDKQQVEPYLDKEIYFEGNNEYWVPSEKEMQFLRKLKINFKLMAKFKVMIKEIGRNCYARN